MSSAAMVGNENEDKNRIAEIDENINSCRNALIGLPEGSDGYLDTLEKLGNLHMDRFKLLSEAHQSDRNEAIDIFREFCRFCPNSERRLLTLHRFSFVLQERGLFLMGKIFDDSLLRVDDTDEAISIEREALSICEQDHNLYGHILGRIGSLLLETTRLPDKREGIQMLRLAIQVWPTGNLNRLEYLIKLAKGLYRLIVASDLTTAEVEMEELSNIYAEIAGYHIGNTEEYIGWLVKSGSWTMELCKPPHYRRDKFSMLSDVATEILKHDSNNVEGKEYLIVATVAQQWESGSLTYDTIEVVEPNHKLTLNELQLGNINNSEDLNITSVYDIGYLPEEKNNFELLKNLNYLSRGKENKSKVEIAALNAAELLRKSNKTNWQKTTQKYQLWAKQVISMDHEFYTQLNLNITQISFELYNYTKDLDDFKTFIQLIYLLLEMPTMSGPYFLNGPSIDKSEPYGHQLASDIETSSFLISHAREVLANNGPSHYKFDLVRHLFDHEKDFYTKDEDHFTEMEMLLNEVILVEPDKLKSPVNKASILLLKYHQTGKVEYLLDAINMDCQNLGTSIEILHAKFLYDGNIEDINEAIRLAHEACSNMSTYDQNNNIYMLLGECLTTRYLVLGSENDLELSIKNYLLTDNFQFHAYMLKYQKYGHTEDLEQVFLYGDFYSPRRSESYYKVHQRRILHCFALSAQYKEQNDAELLEKAINIMDTSKTTCPPTLLPKLILCYGSLILEKSPIEFQLLDFAIDMCKEELGLLRTKSIYWLSLKHILGKLFYEKYKITEAIQDLHSSIQALTDSSSSEYLGLNYSIIHFDLGISLKSMLTSESSHQAIESAISEFQAACISSAASFDIKYKAAVEWAKLAENVNLEEALQAYEYVINVLPHLASLSLDIKNRHERLVKLSLQGIAGDAANCAIKAGNIEKAVEFLEHGRSIFWQQAVHLRSSVGTMQEIDHNPQLAQRLAELARELSISSFSSRSKETSKNYKKFLLKESSRRIELADEWNRLLKVAQSDPGSEILFKPLTYSQLANATSKSIVVLLSITDQTSHAIVIKNPDSPPTSLELPLMTRQNAENLALALRNILKGNNLRDAREVEKVERSGRLHVPFNVVLGDQKMYSILSVLWVRIVKPVLNFIGLRPSKQPVHLTWCCTDVLATLPIHAAGIYIGPKQENLFEYTISSYTSTISNLLSTVSPISFGDAQVLLAGIEKASGYPPLPNVTQEIKYIQDAMIVSAHVDTLMDSEATCNKLLENMANAHVVHLACHGVASPNPLESAIILYDGHLKIDKLMRTPFKNAKLVFLSACQTAEINLLEADESIHIASAMLSTGFKSVIATLWSIDDNDAPVVAKAFYENLIEDGQINIQDSARALHLAINEFRQTGISPLRWVPFIHMGL